MMKTRKKMSSRFEKDCEFSFPKYGDRHRIKIMADLSRSTINSTTLDISFRS